MAEPVIPPGIDPQDPLPEGKWFWRRLIVFLSTLATYGLLAWAVHKTPASDIARLATHLMLLLGGILTLYLVAPSANQITELLATLKLRLRGPRRDDAAPADCDRPGRDGRDDRRDDRNTPPWERRR